LNADIQGLFDKIFARIVMTNAQHAKENLITYNLLG